MCSTTVVLVGCDAFVAFVCVTCVCGAAPEGFAVTHRWIARLYASNLQLVLRSNVSYPVPCLETKRASLPPLQQYVILM